MFTQISVASYKFKQVKVSKSMHSSFGIKILHLFVILKNLLMQKLSESVKILDIVNCIFHFILSI
jgi:hypothetical protein